MVRTYEVNDGVQDEAWIMVLKQLMDAGVTKQEFKEFLEIKRAEKNLSK